MKLTIRVYRQFKRDIKLAKKRHLDMELLKTVIDALSEGKKLDESYRDHPLRGKYVGYRECHILPDWLLIYKVVEKELILVLARTGTHQDLFDE